MNTTFHAPFHEGMLYHVYNRTNDKAPLFRCKEHYIYFLKRYKDYLGDYADNLAYCLMPTHFHFLVRVKEGLNTAIEEQFRRLFISYVKAYNKMVDRHGNLLQRPFNRSMIMSHDQLLRTVCYIHHNPIHHGYCNNYGDWEFCSYAQSGVSDQKGHILPTILLDEYPHENWKTLHREFYRDYRYGLLNASDWDLKFELDALSKREFV